MNKETIYLSSLIMGKQLGKTSILEKAKTLEFHSWDQYINEIISCAEGKAQRAQLFKMI